MKENLMEKTNNATFAIQKVVYLINHIVADISITFIATWSSSAQIKNLVYWYPQSMLFCTRLSNMTFNIRKPYIVFAFSKFRII